MRGSAEWLRLLEAELARRTVRVEQDAGQGLAELEQMALRLAATGHRVEVDPDMAPAELLACHLLAEHLRPVGLPGVDEIRTAYEARRGRLAAIWLLSDRLFPPFAGALGRFLAATPRGKIVRLPPSGGPWTSRECSRHRNNPDRRRGR